MCGRSRRPEEKEGSQIPLIGRSLDRSLHYAAGSASTAIFVASWQSQAVSSLKKSTFSLPSSALGASGMLKRRIGQLCLSAITAQGPLKNAPRPCYVRARYVPHCRCHDEFLWAPSNRTTPPPLAPPHQKQAPLLSRQVDMGPIRRLRSVPSPLSPDQTVNRKPVLSRSPISMDACPDLDAQERLNKAKSSRTEDTSEVTVDYRLLQAGATAMALQRHCNL